MNQVNIIGRLTKDPELRYTPSGAAVSKFTIAVDKKLNKDKKKEAESNNQPTADFINIVAWGALAEVVANYTSKGKQIGISGRIQSGSYEKDGQKVYTTEIVANGIDILEWGDKQDNQEEHKMDYNNIEGFHPTDNNDDIPF